MPDVPVRSDDEFRGEKVCYMTSLGVESARRQAADWQRAWIILTLKQLLSTNKEYIASPEWGRPAFDARLGSLS